MRYLAIALIPALAATALADEVVLQSGGKLMGIAREEGDSIVVETSYGTVTLDRDQVLSIDKTKRSIIEEYKARETEANMSDSKSVWELAQWARDRNLPRQARSLMQKVIELDPNHEFARRDLGYHLFQGQWLTYDETMLAKGFIKYRNKWLTASEKELMVKAEFEEKIRRDEERRKKEEARKPKEPRVRPVVDELNPPPLATMGMSSGTRQFNSGYNMSSVAGWPPAYGIGTASDFRTYLERTYGFYGLHPANYVAWWPFYGNTPWKTFPPASLQPPFPPPVPPIGPQPPQR
jgi:hypothetical protein